MSVTEKLGGYSKFPEEGNFIGQKCLERPMCILRPFRVEEKHWSCSLCKIISQTTVEPPLFPAAQISFFTSLTGVLTGRKNERNIFYPARTSVSIKKSQQTRYLETFQPVNRLMYSVPSQLYSNLQSGLLVERPHQVPLK